MILPFRLTTQVLVALRMSKWYATEALNDIKKRFKHAKKESEHGKNKTEPPTPTPSRGGRMLQTEKQNEDVTDLSEPTCPICLEQSCQIETICGHRFCRECFEQHEHVSERNFLCPYCRKNLSRDHEDLV